MFEITRYPQTRLEHALNSALDLTKHDVRVPMGWRHILKAGKQIDLTAEEIGQLMDSGFLAGDGDEI